MLSEATSIYIVRTGIYIDWEAHTVTKGLHVMSSSTPTTIGHNRILKRRKIPDIITHSVHSCITNWPAKTPTSYLIQYILTLLQ